MSLHLPSACGGGHRWCVPLLLPLTRRSLWQPAVSPPPTSRRLIPASLPLPGSLAALTIACRRGGLR